MADKLYLLGVAKMCHRKS